MESKKVVKAVRFQRPQNFLYVICEDGILYRGKFYNGGWRWREYVENKWIKMKKL